ncbi:MliC family protein [Amorphus orientalis]|uniref:Membrane-bound inhibitor of C-type lysozyme n=1 Tax=Amorphus orientalis TaxID=649198 RepID=A0AAE3VR23_9HYPH|nr:MliC family protein [Amorphus orientalis]MDQ0316598.1 membrane-bound inhibitor of C-type lysozyme [Amorphus orientalis]
MKTIALSLAAALVLAPAGAALAADPSATISIDVPGADEATSQKVTYTCGDKTVAVDYRNAGSVSLALLTIDDDFVVAANVMSGSGARYAGGKYIWWSTGQDAASLTDLMTDDQTPVDCTATK